MNPQQFKEFLLANEIATGKAVEKFVNGKIEKISHKMDDHMEKFNDHVLTDKEFQDSINDNVKWIVRLIIGAVLLGIIAVLFK